jgi:hypothetical protein
MFTRIRYAAQVLSSSGANPWHTPDIVFEEKPTAVISKLSIALGNLIELMVISVVIGLLAAPFIGGLVPLRKVISDVNHLTAVIATVLTFLATQWFEKIKEQIGKRLGIGEKVAPYFGHRIARTYRILRG